MSNLSQWLQRKRIKSVVAEKKNGPDQQLSSVFWASGKLVDSVKNFAWKGLIAGALDTLVKLIVIY